MIQLHHQCAYDDNGSLNVEFNDAGNNPFFTIEFMNRGNTMYYVNLSPKLADVLQAKLRVALQEREIKLSHPDGCMCGAESCPHTRYVTSPEGA